MKMEESQDWLFVEETLYNLFFGGGGLLPAQLEGDFASSKNIKNVSAYKHAGNNMALHTMSTAGESRIRERPKAVFILFHWRNFGFHP